MNTLKGDQPILLDDTIQSMPPDTQKPMLITTTCVPSPPHDSPFNSDNLAPNTSARLLPLLHSMPLPRRSDDARNL